MASVNNKEEASREEVIGKNSPPISTLQLLTIHLFYKKGNFIKWLILSRGNSAQLESSDSRRSHDSLLPCAVCRLC